MALESRLGEDFNVKAGPNSDSGPALAKYAESPEYVLSSEKESNLWIPS